MGEKTLLEKVEEAARQAVPDEGLKSLPRSWVERIEERERISDQRMSDRSDYASLLASRRSRT